MPRVPKVAHTGISVPSVMTIPSSWVSEFEGNNVPSAGTNRQKRRRSRTRSGGQGRFGAASSSVAPELASGDVKAAPLSGAKTTADPRRLTSRRNAARGESITASNSHFPADWCRHSCRTGKGGDVAARLIDYKDEAGVSSRAMPAKRRRVRASDRRHGAATFHHAIPTSAVRVRELAARGKFARKSGPRAILVEAALAAVIGT